VSETTEAVNPNEPSEDICPKCGGEMLYENRAEYPDSPDRWEEYCYTCGFVKKKEF
jgi:hypothetical protein